MKVINWFFFDLLILGYVEDCKSGLSFRMPRGLTWLVYIEVPFCGSLEESQRWIKKEIPTLDILGSPHVRHDQNEYFVDHSVQMVCKYLQACKNGDIDRRLYIDGTWPYYCFRFHVNVSIFISISLYFCHFFCHPKNTIVCPHVQQKLKLTFIIGRSL